MPPPPAHGPCPCPPACSWKEDWCVDALVQPAQARKGFCSLRVPCVPLQLAHIKVNLVSESPCWFWTRVRDGAQPHFTLQ